MTDKIDLGPGPAEEPCAQTLDPDYHDRAKAECAAYITAIRRACGDPPPGARLKTEWSEHEFGLIASVFCVFDGNNREAAEYAALVDERAPRTWEEAGMQSPDVSRVKRDGEGWRR